MSGSVELLIDGEVFTGWKRVRVSRGLETIAASFDLTLSDRWSGASELRPISPHVSCALSIDGEPVVTGVLDQVTPTYDAERHSVSLRGRSLTGQLADCAAIVGAGELKGLSLAAIATRLCEPFGIEVLDYSTATRPFARVALEPGESCFETLQRLADQRAVFLTDDPEGRLVIRRRSTALQGYIERGVNVLSCNGELDGGGQYSNYIVKGQLEGSDSLSVESSTRSSGLATDASVPIHRPLVILADAQGDALTMRERAEFEAARRRGRARRWTYATPGWRRPDGELWAAGEEIEATDDFMGFAAERLLVVEVSFALDDRGGEVTELLIAPPEGFDLIEERETVASQPKAKGWDAL